MFKDLDNYEGDSLNSDFEDNEPEFEYSPDDMTSPEIVLETTHEEPISNSTTPSTVEGKDIDISDVSQSLSRLKLEPQSVSILNNEATSLQNNTSPKSEDNSTIWISCVRCGKKNEIDCNFCGKCGLQIHKTVSIVEPETDENLSPEVSRNIKYHYKRPVFCFGPRGKDLGFVLLSE